MDILTGRLGPRECALAAAFGVLLGLIPKDNLLFVLLAVLFFLSHSNLVLGLVTTAVISFFSPWINEGLSDSLGYAVLTSPTGQKTIAAIHGLPGAAWMMLDNTVVLGALLLGAALFVPVFLLVWVPLKIVWPKKKEAEAKEEQNDSRERSAAQ